MLSYHCLLIRVRYAVEPIATMTACETAQADIQRVLATHAQFWPNVLRSPRMGDGTPMVRRWWCLVRCHLWFLGRAACIHTSAYTDLHTQMLSRAVKNFLPKLYAFCLDSFSKSGPLFCTVSGFQSGSRVRFVGFLCAAEELYHRAVSVGRPCDRWLSKVLTCSILSGLPYQEPTWRLLYSVTI